MVIQIDTREKPKAIKGILDSFQNKNVSTIRSKLFVGDYMNRDNAWLVVDRKQNLLELAMNVGQDSERFKAEIKKATDIGIHIVFLCEHGYGIRTLEDVKNWQNPRLKTSKLAISGERLYKLLVCIANYYGVEFQFCDKSETGDRIIEILENGKK